MDGDKKERKRHRLQKLGFQMKTLRGKQRMSIFENSLLLPMSPGEMMNFSINKRHNGKTRRVLYGQQ